MISRILQYGMAFLPAPRFLTMPAAGIDISDTSIKYFEAHQTRQGLIPEVLDVIRLEKDIVKEGVIENTQSLAQALTHVRQTHACRFVNVALPEELVYLYTLEVPTAQRKKEILQRIEFSLRDHVPIPVENAIYNFDIVKAREATMDISVTVFPKDVIAGYQQAFLKSGFVVKAFELEAHSIVRAVVPRSQTGASMVVDFGRTRTGITIAIGQIPVFSTTVRIGGNMFTDAITRHLHMNEEQSDMFKREQGVVDCDNKALCEELRAGIESLAKEIQRHYRYWHTRHNEDAHLETPITHVYLCGGALAMRGLKERIVEVLGAPVQIGNVWINMLNLDEYIPSINKEQSWSYATAVGLSLRDSIR